MVRKMKNTKKTTLSNTGIVFATLLLFTMLVNSNVSAQGTCLSGNCKNGNGKFRYASGSVFEGSFKNGEMVNGTFYFANGDEYKGSFANAKFHGQGRYVYKKSGNIFEGTYVNGEKVNGTFIYSDGSIYTGDFKNHKKDGKGKFTTAAGKVYDGYWDEDMFAGTTPGNKVNTYALVVAVADYKNFNPGRGDLNFTTNDARAFYRFLLSEQGGKIPESNTKLLLNSEANLTAILQAGEQLFAKADENDRIIFFFSGHGSENGFLPYDIGRNNVNLLSFDMVKELFAGSAASAKLVFADACHSGAIRKDVSHKSPQDVLNDIKIKAVPPDNNKRNIAIMLSSDGDQVSFEAGALKQGVFAHFLMKGLSGSADKNSDNLITMSEIYYFVRDNTYTYVRENMRKTQTPILFGNFDTEMIIAAY